MEGPFDAQLTAAETAFLERIAHNPLGIAADI